MSGLRRAMVIAGAIVALPATGSTSGSVTSAAPESERELRRRNAAKLAAERQARDRDLQMMAGKPHQGEREMARRRRQLAARQKATA